MELPAFTVIPAQAGIQSFSVLISVILID